MQQHSIAGGGKAGQSGDQPAQHTVFIADAFPGQSGNAIADGVPADDGIVIGICGAEVAVSRVLCPRNDGGRDGGYGGKIHVRYPHGKGVKPFFGGIRRKAVARTQCVKRNGVLAAAVEDGSKIVLHGKTPLSDAENSADGLLPL